jgi:small conductance mechanosensitive channel
MDTASEQIVSFVTMYGLNIIGAIVILILGRIAAGIGRSVVGRILEKAKTDPAIISFVRSLIYILILVFAALAALAKFGIQTASFVAVLGAAGFAVGFALQGSLADSSVNFVVRPWVKSSDYWPVKFDMTRKIKEAFDANGIEIPFPQRTIHMVSTS